MSHKLTLNFTFEYEPYGKDPGSIELLIHFGFNPGTPETGRYGPVESYDPGSGHEAWFEYAEREVERDGKKTWERLIPGEWLEGQCINYLDTREECDLIEEMPCRDPDYDRDERRDQQMMDAIEAAESRAEARAGR